MLYATVIFFNGFCPLLSYAIANRIQSKNSKAMQSLFVCQRSLRMELSPLHPNDPWATLIQVLMISYPILISFQDCERDRSLAELLSSTECLGTWITLPPTITSEEWRPMDDLPSLSCDIEPIDPLLLLDP